MGPSPTFLVPSAVHYGSDDADFFEIIRDEDDTPTYILYLGAGDDHVIFDNTGIAPGNGKDLLSAGEGCDTLEGAVAVGGSFVADGGSGDDYFDFDFSFFAHGSATVAGGSGHDYIDVVIMMPPPITFNEPAAAGSLAIDAGDGEDEVHLTYELENTVITSYTFHGNGDVDLGDGDDCLIFDIVGNVPTASGPVTLGPLHISAGEGDDEVAIVGGEYIDSIELLNGVIDTGDGQDEIFLSGPLGGRVDVDAGADNDIIVINVSFSESLAPGTYYDVHGGAGDDEIKVFAEASDDMGWDDAFHVRGGAGMDTFVVTKGQETVVIDDFTLGEDELFLNGIFSEDEFDATLISKAGPASTGIFDEDANLIAVLQGIAPEDLTPGDYTLGEYIPVS